MTGKLHLSHTGFLLFFLFAACRQQELYSEREQDNARRLLESPSFVEDCRGTPAEFAANRRLGMEDAAAIVRGNVSAEEYAAAIKRLSACYEDTRRGLNWTTPPPEVSIPELKAPPVIDGAMDETQWDGAYQFSREFPLNSEHAFADSSAVWRIGEYRGTLYIGCRFRDRDVRAFSGRTGEEGRQPIYEGDSLEVFVHPNRKSRLYYEFLTNPDGELQVLRHAASKLWKWVPVDLEYESGAVVGATRTGDGYDVELAIPMAAFHGAWCGREPLPRVGIHFMLVRTNLDGTDYRRSSPVPLLYDGHNTSGYIRGVLRRKPEEKRVEE